MINQYLILLRRSVCLTTLAAMLSWAHWRTRVGTSWWKAPSPRQGEFLLRGSRYSILGLLKPSENLYGYSCFQRLRRCITYQIRVATKKVVYMVYNFLENMLLCVNILIQYPLNLQFIRYSWWFQSLPNGIIGHMFEVFLKVFNSRIFFEKKTFFTKLLKRNHDM